MIITVQLRGGTRWAKYQSGCYSQTLHAAIFSLSSFKVYDVEIEVAMQIFPLFSRCMFSIDALHTKWKDMPLLKLQTPGCCDSCKIAICKYLIRLFCHPENCMQNTLSCLIWHCFFYNAFNWQILQKNNNTIVHYF